MSHSTRPPERARTLVATIASVAIPAASILVLHRVGADARLRLDLSAPLDWLDRAQPIDALGAVLRLGGLVIAYYVLISTVVYLLALASGNRRLIRTIRPLAIPAVRTVADRLVAGSIAVTTLAVPLLGSSGLDPVGPVQSSTAVASVTTEYLPGAYRNLEADESPPVSGRSSIAFAGRPTTPVPDPEPAFEQAPEVTSAVEGDGIVIVQPGDNLWKIADTVVSRHLGRQATDLEIAPYWRNVVDQNRDRLRSGDPDLIHPGEQVVLPRLA